jgi:hypothetical protein
VPPLTAPSSPFNGLPTIPWSGGAVEALATMPGWGLANDGYARAPTHRMSAARPARTARRAYRNFFKLGFGALPIVISASRNTVPSFNVGHERGVIRPFSPLPQGSTPPRTRHREERKVPSPGPTPLQGRGFLCVSANAPCPSPPPPRASLRAPTKYFAHL